MKASSIIALDVGEKRIGVARASSVQGFASPLTTITHDTTVWGSIAKILDDNDTATVVVGLPRNLSGDDTGQTEYTRRFIADLSQKLHVHIETQDEALTSRKAEEELKSRKGTFTKGDIDALAATYILEDYLNEHRTHA